MTRQVHWETRGTGALDGLAGDAVVTDRDVLPFTAALRALQTATGLEIVAFGGTSFRRPGRAYSVRLGRKGERPTSCLLVLEERAERHARTFASAIILEGKLVLEDGTERKGRYEVHLDRLTGEA